jgi:hypothetical protein
MFSGYVKLDETFVGTLLVTNADLTPVNADALPTFRSYGPDGFVKAGTTTFRHSGTITNATNATPIAITSNNHGLTTGSYITIAGVTGNTAANGTFTVTKVDNNTFTLDASVGNGSYTTGGSWNMAGLYAYTIVASGIDGYESGEVYEVQFIYDLATVKQSQLHTFQVN